MNALRSICRHVVAAWERVRLVVRRGDRRPGSGGESGPLPPVRRQPFVKPVLPVADMTIAATFYESIGFVVERYDDGYAWVKHDGFEFLHLATSDDAGAAAGGAYVHVDDADRWHVAMSASAGNAAVGAVADQPWAMREFGVVDPDGNRVRFGTNL